MQINCKNSQSHPKKFNI